MFEIAATRSLPPENAVAAATLYQLEVALRELITDELSQKTGSAWWRQRVPGDVRKDAFDRMSIEKGFRWVDLIAHHPIYYTDFSELSKIILKKDNWDQVFLSIFKNAKQIEVTLRELEPIRNAVAHNRRISQPQLNSMEHSFAIVTALVGTERFVSLWTRTRHTDNVAECIQALSDELHREHAKMEELTIVGELSAWERARSAWWFDSEFLGADIEPIKELMSTIANYAQLPRRRGMVYVLEEWVDLNSDAERYVAASQILEALRAEME